MAGDELLECEGREYARCCYTYREGRKNIRVLVRHIFEVSREHANPDPLAFDSFRRIVPSTSTVRCTTSSRFHRRHVNLTSLSIEFGFGDERTRAETSVNLGEGTSGRTEHRLERCTNGERDASLEIFEAVFEL